MTSTDEEEFHYDVTDDSIEQQLLEIIAEEDPVLATAIGKTNE